jgi:hypothetical protein
LQDYEGETGYPLAHAWQQRHGPLPLSHRLVPVIPFVLGGTFDLSNLHAVDMAHSMTVRAGISRQLHHLPDGTRVHFTISD